MKKIRTIAFDADDTLWVNEPIFTATQEKFKQIVAPFIENKNFDEQLYQTEIRNLSLFGYGIKGFMLSMIETAIEVSKGQISGSEIQKVIDLGKEMLLHPIEVLPNVRETIEMLKQEYELMVITKGDLFDQESKIARSGLADNFKYIEIVSEKDVASYRNILVKHKINIDEFLMIGNSLKSDILPICELGGKAIHIPFHTTWVHETVASHQVEGLKYEELADIGFLPNYLYKI